MTPVQWCSRAQMLVKADTTVMFLPKMSIWLRASISCLIRCDRVGVRVFAWNDLYQKPYDPDCPVRLDGRRLVKETRGPEELSPAVAYEYERVRPEPRMLAAERLHEGGLDAARRAPRMLATNYAAQGACRPGQAL